MSANSRSYILSRRGTGISNLQSVNMENGELTIDQAAGAGIYKVNCTHHVGIATSTEVGLSADRYVVRVMLVPNATAVPNQVNETVCSYWRIVNAAGAAVPFSRKPIPSDLAIKNLYKYIPGIDDELWSSYDAVKATVTHTGIFADLNTQRDALYDNLQLLNPTAEQQAQIPVQVRELIAASVAANAYVSIKVHDNIYLIGSPHGMDYQAIGSMTADKVALIETMLTASVNYKRLKVRYDTVNDGLLTLASFSIANMFRTGMFESYEHREYYTAICQAVEGQATQYRIISIRTPQGIAAPVDLPVNSVIDVRGLKIKPSIVELANSCVVGSGLMHYLFNHTTGGNIVTGTLLTTLSMYQLVTVDMPAEMQVLITSVIYEALHPTNKRAIANVFFKNTGVTTAGRCCTAPKFEKFVLDSFMTIRCNPYPAGSHKAFICLQALKRVLQAGLGPFLPWAEMLGTCIQTCKEVLTSGARAHIGSAYYTGEPPKAQPATLDNFLPELAQYVRTFNRGDSLSMSPHMAEEIAKKSNMNWQNLLKDLKAKDVSATSADIVRAFLATSGSVHFAFDPADQGTWGKAVTDSGVALRAIDEVFN